jgi:cysteine desulfurase
MKMIYLDNSATTKQYDEVTDLMYRVAKDTYGNPSSLHSLGFEANNMLTDARRDMEAFMAPGGEIIFTSGGTESDNMALVSTARKMKRRGKRIITTEVEHPAVLETCRRLAEDGFEIVYAGVDDKGLVKTEDIMQALTDDTIMVSVMTVNNESGTIQPVNEISRMVREYNKKHGTAIVFHTDAVQAFGKLPVSDINADLVSVSGHKFHGPRGTGFLYMRKDLKLPAFITGGGQENHYRSSTENLPGIAGMALAAKMSYKDLGAKMARMSEVNDHLYRGLTAELKDVVLNGPEKLGCSISDADNSAASALAGSDSSSDGTSVGPVRCPAVLNLTFKGTRGEVLLHTLEQDGIFVSTGSACASHKTGDSHVLSAMGLDHKAIEGAIRFSFSEFSTIDEMDVVIDKVKTAVNRFRRLGSFR